MRRVLLSCVLFACVGCQASAPPTPEPVEKKIEEVKASNWEKSCAQSRAKLRERVEASILYEPTPETPQGLNYWSLTWHGVSVPIPVEAFQEVIVKKEADGTPGVIFVLRDVETIMLLVHDHQKLEELGGLTTGDVIYRSFEWTPDSIKCTDATRTQDHLQSQGVVLKRLTLGAERVYKDVGSYQGYLYSGTRNGNAYWEAFFAPKSWETEQLGVAYNVSGANAKVGLLLGNISGDAPSAAAKPGWFAPLQGFLTDPSDANLQAFEAAANKSGLGPKTTAAIARWRVPNP